MELTIENAIGDVHRLFRQTPEEQDRLKLALFRQNFAFHYHANAFFRTQCERQGLRPEELNTVSDLRRIPLIPVRFFKQPQARVLISVPLNTIDLGVQSIDADGILSLARRERVTLARTNSALISLYREFFSLNNGAGLFLCPPTAKTPEMGMVKAFDLFCDLFDDQTRLVREYAFRAEEAIACLKSWEHKQTRHLFGPLFMINRLLRLMESEPIRLELDPDSYVITFSGWKHHNDEPIRRDVFNLNLQHRLGVGLENIRDIYGVTESHMLAIECEYRRKHVPPWCHISIRDVSDVAVDLPPGRTGFIAILDAMSNSYPSYILSDDVGEIEHLAPCPCGRVGQVITSVVACTEQHPHVTR